MNSIVLGTFYGDEGKGQFVHNLCKQYITNGKTCLVIRFSGGHQVGHNVVNKNIHHCFSNFGSGTLIGIPTYWSEYCTVDPYSLKAERQILLDKGIIPIISYSPWCQIITPFDVWHQRDNMRNRQHGTVGTGFKSCLDRVKAGYSLTMQDALHPLILRYKLYGIIKNYYKTSTYLNNFNLDDWLEVVHEYAVSVKLCHLNDIAGDYDDLIFEGSQGILLDQRFGIMPYCTPSNTTCVNAGKLLESVSDKVDDAVNHYYVCRPYITRHGNGPLCTDKELIDVTDENNKYNEFQGSMRACEFSVDLLKHSLSIDAQFFRGDNHTVNLVFSHGDELSDSLIGLIRKETSVHHLYKFEFENMESIF